MKKEKILEKIKNVKKGELVITLKPKHFKKELSTEIGFGYQDLKKKPKKMIKMLIKEGFDVKFIPTGIKQVQILKD